MPCPLRVGFRFLASLCFRKLANTWNRIEFNMVVLMDWQFASGCSPPRLSTTQLPPATDSQCSVRRGLSPLCWCALSGALKCAFGAPDAIPSTSMKGGRAHVLRPKNILGQKKWPNPSRGLLVRRGNTHPPIAMGPWKRQEMLCRRSRISLVLRQIPFCCLFMGQNRKKRWEAAPGLKNSDLQGTHFE